MQGPRETETAIHKHIWQGNNKMSVNQANPRHVLEFTRGQELRGLGTEGAKGAGRGYFDQGVSGSLERGGGQEGETHGEHRRYAKHAKRI